DSIEQLTDHAAVDWSEHPQPELALLSAVLREAVDTLLAGSTGRRTAFREARDWFLSDDVCWPFSFLRICDALDLEPEAVRARLPLPPGISWECSSESFLSGGGRNRNDYRWGRTRRVAYCPGAPRAPPWPRSSGDRPIGGMLADSASNRRRTDRLE